MKDSILVLDSTDNVGIVVIENTEIPIGHKVALKFIPKDTLILKFGYPIGIATEDIDKGKHVHVHNVKYDDKISLPSSHDPHAEKTKVLNCKNKTFKGYLRKNGNVGIRNYIVVAATVNCSATVVKRICQKFAESDLSRYNIDGIVPVTHQAGCAQAIGGLNHKVLNRTLAGWIYHPNVVGALVVGLGCEGTTWKSIEESARKDSRVDSNLPISFLGIQESGGTAAAIENGILAIEALLKTITISHREELPVSHLNLSLNCGGSDAFSSLTANPLLGYVSDLLVIGGGAVTLAEIPECHGAEGLLKSRAKNQQIQTRLDALFDWWNVYAKKNNVNLNNNLAPGNIAGGITTIIEKSLGAVAKAGHSPLCGVVDYSEPMKEKGFLIMNTPGFDPVSVTGLVAGGSQIVAFTTGRGSVYGCGIAPTIKIATNSSLFRRMKDDMDFDSGRIISGEAMNILADELYNLVIDVASGSKTKSELLGMGAEEFTPWPIGETL